MEPLKKKRCTRTTADQYRILIEALQEHECLVTNKRSPVDPNGPEDAWKATTQKLNETGDPTKPQSSRKQ